MTKKKLCGKKNQQNTNKNQKTQTSDQKPVNFAVGKKPHTHSRCIVACTLHASTFRTHEKKK